ncbi:MAG: hypothetical protein ACKVH8_21360 [Pirellulales bacterium]
MGVTQLSYFLDELVTRGWSESDTPYVLVKGSWRVVIDTSSWVEVQTSQNERVFDVCVPDENRSEWTINLIEYLCSLDDERFRLRKSLKSIGTTESNQALEICFHTWLQRARDESYCSICGITKAG